MQSEPWRREMPSPFPGMDPFIEAQRWRDFHAAFVATALGALVQKLRPRYEVSIDEHLYPVGSDPDEVVRLDPPSRQRRLMLAPMTTRRAVTVIEHLLPWNKDSRTHDEYLRRRRDLLDDGLNLVEIDLLRGGRRLPPIDKARMPGDYFVCVVRSTEPSVVSVWPWSLRDCMPVIPVPLSGADADVALDLQTIFEELYDRSGYDYSLRYDREVSPPLSDANRAWVEQLLRDRRGQSDREP